MIEISAIVTCIVLTGLTLFQIALICGAPIGKFAWGGSHAILPMNLRVASVTSIFIYSLFAVIILSEAGLIQLLSGHPIATVGIWVLAVYFAIGIILNGISRSKPERNLMTPVALILAITTTIVALG